MSAINFLWNGYKYFPYEREFAKREVEAFLGHVPLENDEGLQGTLNGTGMTGLERLTYFREIILPNGEKVITVQARLEASAKRNGCTNRIESAIQNTNGRQSTRYSAHGLHEYKGKFNPQVVRAIGNMIGLSPGAWVLDPFCGSGTTLLECAHAGWNAIGVDLNPLAVLMSNAKVRAISTPAAKLQNATQTLISRLNQRTKGLCYEKAWTRQEINHVVGDKWSDLIPNCDYLAGWFPPSVLAQLAIIIGEIDQSVAKSLAPIFRVILSDLAREVSLQDPDDLRMRRRKDPKANYPLVPMFLKAVETRIGTVIKARQTLGRTVGRQQAFVMDNRAPLGLERQFDAVITSPPYATALPYIDTQRLSLCLLGLIESSGVMRLDRELIGAREIGQSKRKELEKTVLSKPSNSMPQSVVALCQQMLELSSQPGNGFRRRNMPALIYRYFSDMTRMFQNVHKVVRPSGIFALVVGRNRTELAGKSISIDTPQMLADLASVTGWRPKTCIELNTYQRFDMHQRNSIHTECLILLERA
jgi:SAM-dependent methyltransferase